MKRKTIITNLRIPKEEWLQIRAIAAEMGISANEYVRRIITQVSTQQIISPPGKGKDYQNAPIWNLPKLAKGVKDKPMELSEEDRIIYEV